MEITNRDIVALFQCTQNEEKSWTKNTEINQLRFAVMNLRDELTPHYMEINQAMTDLVTKHAELDENGNPKMAAKLVSISDPTAPQKKEIIWKTSIEEYQKEEMEYMKTMRDVSIRKYELEKLLECKPKYTDENLYPIIKTVSL